MRLLRLSSLVGGFLSLLLPEIALMAIAPVGTTVGSTPCIISTLPCPGGGVSGFNGYLFATLLPGARIVFLAAAIIMFTVYGVRLILESTDESTVSEVKSAYTYGIAGSAIVSLASIIVQTVGQYGSNGQTIVDSSSVNSVLDSIVFFMRVLVGTAVSAVVVYQGVRMIILQGDEGELEKQKTRFFHTLIGVAIITLASAVVADFAPGTGSNDLALQMIGIGNFLLVIIGGVSVLALIAAGFMLIVSTDEALKDRAKKSIFAAITGIMIVLCVSVIINFVVQLNSSGFIVF